MDIAQLQAALEQMMLDKKAEEAHTAEEEADGLHDYMEKDELEHKRQALEHDSDGNEVPRFKRITKGFYSNDSGQ
jgi:hypothetical protein